MQKWHSWSWCYYSWLSVRALALKIVFRVFAKKTPTDVDQSLYASMSRRVTENARKDNARPGSRGGQCDNMRPFGIDHRDKFRSHFALVLIYCYFFLCRYTYCFVRLPVNNGFIDKVHQKIYAESVSLYDTQSLLIQEIPTVADKPARRLRKVCTVYVRAVGL